jgi:hypothetical protein
MNRRHFLTAGVPVSAGLTMGTAHPAMAASESKRVLSVTDFGAEGDGRADDTAAVQRTFDAVTDFGCIYFPLGTYRLTNTVTLHECRNVRITGDGAGSRIIADTEMKDLIRLEQSFHSGMIDHLTIDGNGRAETALRVVGGSYSRMDNLEVWNARNICIHCGRTDDIKSGVECMITNSRIVGMRQEKPTDPGTQRGILVGGHWSDGHYNNLVIKGCVDTAMEVQGGTNVIHEAHIYRSPCFQFRHALRVKGVAYIAQSYMDNFTHTGIEVLAGGTLIQTCFFLRWTAAFGDGPVSHGDCIRIGDAEKHVKNVSILGCNFMNWLPDEPRYANGDLTTIQLVNGSNVISRDHQYENVPPGETEGSGSVIVPIGHNRVEVEHQLIGTPRTVQLTPVGQADGGSWVENLGDTQFTVRLANAPIRDLQIFWNAKS